MNIKDVTMELRSVPAMDQRSSRDASGLAGAGTKSPNPDHSIVGYRADIDGLRAVAVMSVLLYHLRLPSFGGGFVGVDVFFVISGYLIGSLIIRESAAGKLRLAGFYARRARRILPALLAMTCSVLLLGYLWLLPSEFAAAAQSGCFAMLSVSNTYFFAHLSYFEPLASTQPLLHTWSLGIEEQFYLVFPLLLLTLLRLGSRALAFGVATVAVLSFAWGCHEVVRHAQADFFLAHTRAWELLLGTLVYVLPFTRHLSKVSRNVLALAGLAMICWSVSAYSLETPFPGAAALVPCGGAAFIVAAGRSGSSFVGNLLAWRTINFVGRISYSLYLWHWPIIFFQVTHPFLPGAGKLGDRLAVTLYSLVVATISWLCIEQPFRNRCKFLQPRKILFGSAAAVAGMVIVCCSIVLVGGFPQRFKPLALHYASYMDSGQAHFRQGTCFITTPYTFADFDRAVCLTARPGERNDLLVGDSHAAQLWYGLAAAMPDVHVMQATASACLPAADPPASEGRSCADIMKLVFQTYLPRHHVDRLLIAARWTEGDLQSLKTTLALVAALHIPVTLFGPMIEYDQKLPRLLAWAAQANEIDTVGKHQLRETGLDGKLRGIAAEFKAQYASIYTLLCGPIACPAFDPEGNVLEFDTDHLTKEGSLFLINRALAVGLLR